MQDQDWSLDERRITAEFKTYWRDQATEPNFLMEDAQCHQAKKLGDDCCRYVLSYGRTIQQKHLNSKLGSV
jgi:hypothetical protein